MITASRFQKYNPHRKPDWRWQQAMAAAGSGDERGKDFHIRETVRYLRTINRQADARDGCPSRGQPRAVAEAHHLRNGDPWLRMEIETRLLAGQTPDEISGCTGVSEEALLCYEAVFFNVQDRLQAHGYVWCQYLSPAVVVCRGEAFIRGVAYFGGIVALEAVLAILKTNNRAPNQPADLATPAGRLAELVSLALQVAAIPSTAQGTVELLRAMPTILDALRRTSATTTEPVSEGLAVTVPPTALQGSLNRLDELTRNTAEEQPVADVNAA